MARKPKKPGPATDLDTQTGGVMTLTDDDIGLGPVLDGTDLPDDDEDEVDEDPDFPQGVFSQEKPRPESRPDPDTPDAPNTPDTPYLSSESELPIDMTLPVTGRPRRDGMPAGSAQQPLTDKLRIPTPRYNTFKSDAAPVQRPKAFYTWWNALPTWAKDRLVLYVYREWPILLPAEDDESNYIDKISGNEPIQDDTDLLNRYGCGSYKLMLNDTSLKGNAANIVRVFVGNLGGGDIKSNPPTDRRISNAMQVDRFHPANGSYISFLQLRGLLPEQNQKKGDDTEMPALVEIIREQNKDKDALVSKILDMAQADKKEEGHTEKAMAEVVGIVSAGAKEAMKMQRESAEFSQQIREQALAEQAGRGGDKQDPMQIALQIVQLIRGTGNDGGNAEVLELRRQILEMQSSQIKDLQTQLIEVMKTKTDNSGLGSLKDTLSNVKELRELMSELGGDKDDTKEAVAEAAGEMAPKWLRPYVPIISTIAQAAMPAIANWLQPGAGAMPNPGQQFGPGPGQAPVPGAPPTVHGGPAQLAGPGSGPAPGPQTGNAPGPQPVPTPQQQQLAIILQSITYPLITHLTAPTVTGGDFAEWFSDGFGVDTFKTLAGYGEDAVASALLGYSPITTLMQQHGVNQVRFRTFVKEFCETEFEDSGDGDTVTATPSATPPVAQGPGSGSGGSGSVPA